MEDEWFSLIQSKENRINNLNKFLTKEYIHNLKQEIKLNEQEWPKYRLNGDLVADKVVMEKQNRGRPQVDGITSYMNLLGAVIQMAILDAKEDDTVIKKMREDHRKAAKDAKKDALDFLETDRLENFLESWRLHVDADVIRYSAKVKKIKNKNPSVIEKEIKINNKYWKRYEKESKVKARNKNYLQEVMLEKYDDIVLSERRKCQRDS
jgi:hypothetical protein